MISLLKTAFKVIKEALKIWKLFKKETRTEHKEKIKKQAEDDGSLTNQVIGWVAAITLTALFFFIRWIIATMFGQ